MDTATDRYLRRLPAEFEALTARQRLAEGWTHGPERNDAARRHPDLVPYADRLESEKEYDRPDR